MPNTVTSLTAQDPDPLFDFLLAVLRRFRQKPCDARRMSSVAAGGLVRMTLQFALASANALLVHTGSQNKRPSQSQQQQ